jgi:hypothetical protein
VIYHTIRRAIAAIQEMRTTPLTNHLDYAKAPPWRNRKSVRRATLALFLAIILLAALKFARPAWNHARLLHYQSRCLKHALPADRVVFDNNAQSNFISPDWDRFYTIFSPPGGKRDATLLVHELHRPDAPPRLVVLELFGGADFVDSMPPPYAFDITVIDPAGLWSRPKLVSNRFWLSPFRMPLPPSPQSPLRIYAGQLDPANPAHFTIDYEYRGKTGTIDGWLQSDDTILLEPRTTIANDP